jgi:hypothetical protein
MDMSVVLVEKHHQHHKKVKLDEVLQMKKEISKKDEIVLNGLYNHC